MFRTPFGGHIPGPKVVVVTVGPVLGGGFVDVGLVVVVVVVVVTVVRAVVIVVPVVTFVLGV